MDIIWNVAYRIFYQGQDDPYYEDDEIEAFPVKHDSVYAPDEEFEKVEELVIKRILEQDEEAKLHADSVSGYMRVSLLSAAPSREV